MQGAHIYAGFLETWLETKSYDSKSKSKRKHWDSKVRPDYRAVDNIEIKDKALKELRSLGFTTAHIAPDQGIFRGQTGVISLSDQLNSINSSVAQAIDFKYRAKKNREYPRSLLGVIAHWFCDIWLCWKVDRHDEKRFYFIKIIKNPVFISTA